MNSSTEKSLSVIVPAFNEEGNIQNAIDSVLTAIKDLVDDYEIIVVNDGSSDNTEQLALAKRQGDERIRVISNASNQGFGFSFARGVSLAGMNFLTVFPGDNDMAGESLRRLIENLGRADIVTSHPVSSHRRPFLRRFLSKSFIALMNILFGLNLKYYNGAFVARTSLIRLIPIKSTGLTALAECLIRLIKAGHSYTSIPFEHVGRKAEKSKALYFKSVVAVAVLIIVLWKDLCWSSRLVHQKPVCSI